MRRGLLAWSPSEISADEFGRRLAAVRARFADNGIDVLLVYTNFARPSAISYLTNVVPFWSEAMLVVPAEGETTLVVGLPKRDVTVIRPTGCFDELVCDPDARTALVEVLRSSGLIDKRIAIYDADGVPAPFANAITAARNGETLTQIGPILDTVDDDGSSAALQQKAADIARNALGAANVVVGEAASLVAMIELNARLAGAEEVQVLVAPDLAADARLRRIETEAPLGERFAICVSLAYKGHWVRLGRSVSRSAAPASWDEAGIKVASVAAGLAADADIGRQVQASLGELNSMHPRFWAVEGLSGASPLALLAHHEGYTTAARAAQLVVFSAWLDLPDGPYFAAATARVGEGLLAA